MLAGYVDGGPTAAFKHGAIALWFDCMQQLLATLEMAGADLNAVAECAGDVVVNTTTTGFDVRCGPASAITPSTAHGIAWLACYNVHH